MSHIFYNRFCIFFLVRSSFRKHNKTTMSDTEISVPKKRGRPSLKKALEPTDLNSSISDNEVSVIVSPKRGRPAKQAVVESNEEETPKRGRGRPPKNASSAKKVVTPARSVGRPAKRTSLNASGENEVRIRINKEKQVL